MRSVTVGIGVLIFAVGVVAGTTWSPRADAQGLSVVMDCVSSTPQIRTTLYFGLARPKGAVSELEWQMFLRDEVTKRFPDGFTVWEAEGQWRTPGGTIDHERSKVMLVVHPDTPQARHDIHDIIASYRRVFEQQSVLWESARVCGAS
jgi:Protein of unknown function (DUF3574)